MRVVLWIAITSVLGVAGCATWHAKDVAAPDDPLYHQAINFCHGYLVGAYHYHEAAALGPAGIQLVCAPDPRPSRNDTIDMFIDWAKAHPQHWGEPAVETEFRFLKEKWPCKP